MGGIFVSHASTDDDFVAQLRERLEELGLAVWVDSRRLRGGDRLAPEIESAIDDASQVVVVLSPATVNSPWVLREVRAALQVRREHGDGYRVIPVLRPGITVAALGIWFPDEEPVAVVIGQDGLAAAMPQLLAALGERLPTDPESFTTPEAGAVEELILRLSDPRMLTQDGRPRATATAQLVYEPAQDVRPPVESARFGFTAPLGPIEAADLRWYLERYWLWPVGVFRDRAAGIEARLPQWGQALLTAVRTDEKAFQAWERAAGDDAVRRFSVLVDDDPPMHATPEETAAAREATTELLALPWELLHDGATWLFQGRNAVRVRRRLPNRADLDKHRSGLPIRILLVSPRPERSSNGALIGHIDHRASARPLVEAVENLGELARLTLLPTPSYAALEQALREGDEGQPFDVVHFNGHGVYDRKLGLGGLCFEQPQDEPDRPDRPDRCERILDFVDATRLAGMVRQHRIPLVFLEACQTALAEADPTASVAARLLDEGVASVVAMTHSVLVETSRRFVQAFYRELATGARVGTAMLAGQRALYGDPRRGKILGAGELRLQDWFVPVLYQEHLDPQPISRLPSPTVQRLAAQGRTLRLGELPEPPEHHFQGRSQELLALARHLHHAAWAVVRGTGGQGKSTLAVELARWLVRTQRAQRAVFVNLEHHRDPHAVLDAIGRQLVPAYTVAEHSNLDQARLPVARALTDQPVILVVDNCESVLPDPALTEPTIDIGEPGDAGDAGDSATADGAGDTSSAIFTLFRHLMDADPRTRLVFTTREPLPKPFARHDHAWDLGALHRDDAVELVGQVMKQHGWTPPSTDTGTTPEDITALVEAVHGHPRALVLLAREIAERGVRATAADLGTLMADLDRAHPGDRENSLYASIALSLRRVPPETRGHVRALACCHGGAHVTVIAELTGLDVDAARRVGGELILVGLGEDMDDGYLRLDPGLAPYLLAELTPADTEALRTRWADVVTVVTAVLGHRQSQDAQLVQRLTLLELPNLLALLDWLPDHKPPAQVVEVAAQVENRLRPLGQRRALEHAVQVRQQAAGQLMGGWNRARHSAAYVEIDRLWQRRKLSGALTAAQRLLDQHLAAGEAAYPGADFDTAMSFMLLGRVLGSSGAAHAALTPLDEAVRRFQQLDEAGHEIAALTLRKARKEIGDRLRELGRLDEAGEAYQDAIERATRLGDRRAAAVAETEKATLLLVQNRYQEALEGYTKGREIFETMGEPKTVGSLWHQTGIAYQEAGQFDAAEDAYRHALAIFVREASPEQAHTLVGLGQLYAKQGRLEESLKFSRQSAEIFVRSGDRANERIARRTLALTLLNLRRTDEARQELKRAIACEREYGHAAEPWNTWAMLEALERTTGHSDAARAAREQGIATYLAYRGDGGASHSDHIQICEAAAKAISENQQDELAQGLSKLLGPDTPRWVAALIGAVQAILAGQRDPTLADNPDIKPTDAAELLHLLKTLPRSPQTARTRLRKQLERRFGWRS